MPADSSGLKQDTAYRIEAGDAVSATYQLQVSPAPNITVTHINYEYPAYMKRAPETISGHGDLQGVEGTRVTIQAKANQPIRAAYIEFDPGTEPATVNGNRLPMDVKAQMASQTFVLKLRPDRKGTEHAAYQLRFTTISGRENSQPTLHQIAVTPDLAPEVEILTPTKTAIELPLDAVQPIEVRGLDPDFGLTLLRLQAVRGNSELLGEALFADQGGALGQTMGKLEFRPRDHGLEVGDRVIYWVLAEDNRAQPGGDSPEPNQTRTREYEFLITPPLKGDESAAGENESTSPKQSDNEAGENTDTPKEKAHNSHPTSRNQATSNPRNKLDRKSSPKMAPSKTPQPVRINSRPAVQKARSNRPRAIRQRITEAATKPELVASPSRGKHKMANKRAATQASPMDQRVNRLLRQTAPANRCMTAR